MKRVLSVLAAISVLILINDIIEIVIAYRKRRKELNREAIRRLRRNRKRKKRRQKSR